MIHTNNNILVLLAFLILAPASSQAEDWIKQGEETFSFGLGAFLPAFNTTLRVDNQTVGAGDSIDLEDDLGLKEDESVFWVGGTWRFADRHRLGVSYFSFNRDASATALRELEIGDEIYPVGASLETEFSLTITPIYYAYSFIKNEKHELAGSFGFHWFALDFAVQGDASLNGEDANANASATADVPLPLFGIRYDYYINQRWTTSLHGEIFALDITDEAFKFSGNLYNIRLSTDYWLTKNFGIGAAVSWFDIDAKIDDSEWKGEIEYRYFGPQIYIQARI